MAFQFLLSGCGRIGDRHAACIADSGVLAGVYDPDPAAAREMAGRYGVPAYPSFEEMLDQRGSATHLAVCSPNGWHAEQVIKGLQARLDVICEKPLCLTPAAAWQILETEKFSRRRLTVVKSTRFHPLLRILQAEMEGGQLGPLYSFALQCLWQRPAAYFSGWKGTAFPDGGVLYTQFSHYLDALIWLGGAVTEVSGFRSNRAHASTVAGEDTGAAALRLESGAIGSLHWSVNTAEHNHEIGLNLITEKATLRIGGAYLDRLEYFAGPEALREKLEKAGPLPDHHRELYAAIREGRADSLSGTMDGLRTVEAIDLIYRKLPVNP